MIIGIVGAEARKFTPVTEQEARREIRDCIRGATMVVSGRSPLGGIDWWAIEEAERLRIATREYPPQRMHWEGGYKQRNLQIAEASDTVVCIVVKTLPENYKGMRFPSGCYHCHTPPEHHVKSGGCYTMKQAIRLGKDGRLVVIRGDS